MKTYLITGTKGFIGKNLVNFLQKNGEEIIINIDEEIFELSEWEIELKRILIDNQPDVIFHIGACSNTQETDVNYMMKLNFQFTKILVDWSKENNSKLIYSSSAANYGQNSSYPSNLYGWSKYVAEQYVISNNGVALRYFNVYGPGEEHKGKMASIAFQSYQNKKNNITSKLFLKKPKRDFVYVKDVISANIFAMQNYNKLNKKWFDVGSGEASTFEEVLEKLNILYYYHFEKEIPDGYQFYTCSDKTNWMSGWMPIYNLEQGLKEYKEYLSR